MIHVSHLLHYVLLCLPPHPGKPLTRLAQRRQATAARQAGEWEPGCKAAGPRKAGPLGHCPFRAGAVLWCVVAFL